mgnify:FL=1
MELGTQVYVLVDHAKYEKVYFAHVPLLENVALVTSAKAMQGVTFQYYAEKYNFIGGTL